jgi:hypothetical protein
MTCTANPPRAISLWSLRAAPTGPEADAGLERIGNAGAHGMPFPLCAAIAPQRLVSAIEQKRQGNGTVASARGARIPQIDWKTVPVSGDRPRLADHNSRPPRNENVTRKLEGGGLTTLLQVDYFLPALRETIAAIRGSRIARFRGQLPTFYLTIIRSAP